MPVLVVGWAVTQLGIQALLAAITAVLPDQVPPHQRGRIGGLVAARLRQQRKEEACTPPSPPSTTP